MACDGGGWQCRGHWVILRSLMGLDYSSNSPYSFNTMFMQSSLLSEGGSMMKKVDKTPSLQS